MTCNKRRYGTAEHGFCYKYYDDDTNNRYFLDGCAAAFDAPGEWYADDDGHLNLRLPSGVTDIDAVVLRGKIQTYAMAFTSCGSVIRVPPWPWWRHSWPPEAPENGCIRRLEAALYADAKPRPRRPRRRLSLRLTCICPSTGSATT